jgi:hypothetical protein
MTFTTAYYVYIWDSPSILSTNVWYNTSTVSRSINTYVNKGWTSMCTIVWHRLGNAGTIFWSIGMYINDWQMCVLTFCWAEEVWCIRYCCTEHRGCVLLLEWVPLYWLLIFVQYGEVDNLTNGGKNWSWSKLNTVVQICAVVTKNVRGTKMIMFDNWERIREMRGNVNWGVYQRWICYTPCITESLFCMRTELSVYEALSLVWKQVFNLMGWDEHDLNHKWILIPDVRCCTGSWSTVVITRDHSGSEATSWSRQHFVKCDYQSLTMYIFSLFWSI